MTQFFKQSNRQFKRIGRRKPLPDCGLCRIDLENVCVARGHKQLLQDVSVHIHCGQLTAIVGQNGAGKTTLMKTLLGLMPYEGSIRHVDVNGRPVPHLRTGYVPQHLDFDREMPVTVEDFLAASMTKRPVWLGISKKTKAQVSEALALVGAQGLEGASLGRLSGGELQRVLLAMALTPMPDLLLLDEPVSGVDRNGQIQFLDMVMSLRRTYHMAILLVSHDLPLVQKYADYVVLLSGQVLTQGTPKEVFASPEFERVFGGTEATEE